MIYFIKGLLIPLALVTKKLFSFSQICDGNTILILYNALMELLYVKNYFYSLGNLFYESLLKIKIKGFKLKEFLSKDNQRDTLEEYFMTKSQQNYSAFDFSKLYLAFEKHLYKFILHPHSFNLNENFSINELELYKRIDNYILYNKSNNTKKISINISNSLTFNTSENINNIDEYTNEDKQDIANTNINYTTNEKINNNSNNTINANHKQKTQLIVPKTKVGNFDYTNTLTLNNDDNYTDNIIISIYSIYKNKKSTLTNTTSSFFMALPETCYQHESNFRKIFLQVLFLFIINNKSPVYLTQSYQLLYILLSLDTSETQNDIKNILLLSLPSSLPTDKFITSLSHHLYISLMKVFMNELSIENPIMLFIHSYRVFNLLKICKYLCEEHNNYFQNKIINQLTYKYFNWVDLTLQNQHNKSYLISKKEESESDSEEKLIEMNIINNQNKISNNNFDNVNTLENISFFNFLINVLTKIIIITSQVKKSRHVEMYYDIISCIIDFLVEGIQGNKNDIICKRNFLSQNEIIQNQQSIQTFHIFSQKVSDILFNDSLNTGHPFKVRMLLMSFFISLFEDEKNEDLQKIVIKFLNIKRVLNSIISTLKMYFFKKQTSIGNTTFQNINEVIFDYNVYCFYKKEYTYNNLLHESDEFNLAHVYYNYIKLLSVFNRLPEAVNLLKKTSQVNEDVAKKKYKIENKSNGHKSIANKLFKIKESKISPCNLISNKEKVIKIEEIEIYFTLKLFENITKVVELRLPSNQTQLVLYTLPSEMIYLSKMTKKEFFANVDRTSENSKKNALIKHIALFQKEINYYKKRQSNCLGRILSKVNYIYVQIFVYIYVVTFNIVIISTLQGYKELEETETINTRLRLRSLFSIPSKINESIDTSLNEWAVIYDILAYIFVCMNAFFIIVWIIFRLPLYYKLDKIVYLEENKIKSKHDISMCQKIYIAIVKSIFERDHINSLLFMFILSLVGVILKRGEIIYGFCLLAIVDLNQTLKGIILAVQRRYSSLGATGLLMIALVYFYTNIGFFFFNEDYEAIIETEETDNYCESLVFCFLTNIDAGIRARGGTADQMKRISFERNMGHYVTRLFFDVTYFLICIIIMIDLVFGIILGTFSELRAEEIKYQDDKENHCFICHVSREEIEKKGKVDFDFHRENLHNLWTYVEYMIFLKFSKLHDLNAPNAYAKEMLDRKNICFLPSEGNGEKEKEEDFDNELNLENKLEEEEEETDEEEEEDDNEQNNLEEI
jgi:hypothetical protein